MNLEKVNFFSQRSRLYPFRWFIVITLSVAAFMAYHDLFGGRMFTSQSKQEQWSSSGPGAHK